MEPIHLLHSMVTRPSSVIAWRLKSKHSFVLTAQQLNSSSDNNVRAVHWAYHQWNAEWWHNLTRLCTFTHTTSTHSPRMTLPTSVWAWLNRPCTGVGRFHSCLCKWVWSHLRPVSVAQKNK